MKYLIFIPLIVVLYGCDTAHSNVTLHNATLNWTLPTERETPSNEPLVLAGVRIYYGANSGLYDNVIDIPDGLATTYTVTGLLNNPYYFALTAYDTSGRESVYSNEWAAQIDVPKPMRPTITAVEVN